MFKLNKPTMHFKDLVAPLAHLVERNAQLEPSVLFSDLIHALACQLSYLMTQSTSLLGVLPYDLAHISTKCSTS